jgi:hypothetical protein
MNAERLHHVARNLRHELQEGGSVVELRRMTDALVGLSNNPGDSAAQQQLSEAVAVLRSNLPTAASNEWPPSDRQIVDELGLTDYLGAILLERIDGILQSNELTPAVALEEVRPLHERLTEVDKQLDSLLAALDFFAIGADELHDQVEVGIAIPREAVNNGLQELGVEFTRLRKIVGPFQELATGTRDEVEVRAIASSDFSVFLAAAPIWALSLAKAIRELVLAYEKIVEIKRQRAEMQKLDIPEKAFEKIDEHAQAQMGTRIGQLVEELIKDAHGNLDANRSNELRIDLKLSLEALAGRLDRGYGIDIRTPEEEAPVEGEETSAADTDIQTIRRLSVDIKYFEAPGSPILQLPDVQPSGSVDTADGDAPRRRPKQR